MESTRAVIARRLSAIRYGDQILVMEKGRIMTEGTDEELMENNK